MSKEFLGVGHLDVVRDRVRSGEEPWAAAYKQLLAAADRALGEPLLDLRQNGGSPLFRQDAVYVPGQDGVVNTQGNRESGRLAHEASRNSIDQALAWRLTGDGRYARRALAQIHAWCINRNTCMTPTGCVVDAFTPGFSHGGDIIVFHSCRGLFLAGHLLRDCPEWDPLAHDAVRRWVRDMLAPQREIMFYEGREMYNNWEDARLLYLAYGALMLDDLDLLAYVFERWRHILPMKMTDAGELPRETMRTKSMQYTLGALRQTAEIAEIARQQGVDLYGYAVGPRCLKLAVDYAAGFLLDMSRWPFKMIEPLTPETASAHHLGLFELAHARWRDRRYLDVIAAYGGRPVGDSYATLLYADD